MSSVPDAHFDWNNSGLTNPLDSCKYICFENVPAFIIEVLHFFIAYLTSTLTSKMTIFKTDSHSSLLDLDLLASFDIHSPYYRKKCK